MKKVSIKLSKELLEKVRDELNLVLFNLKDFSVSDMKIVNNILRGLENAKIVINII